MLRPLCGKACWQQARGRDTCVRLCTGTHLYLNFKKSNSGVCEKNAHLWLSRLSSLAPNLVSLVSCPLHLASSLSPLLSCLLSLISCLLSLVSFVFGLLSLASKLIPSTSTFKLDLPTPHPSLVNVEVCYPHTLCSSTLDGGGRGYGGWGRDARTRNSNIDVDGRSAEGDGEWGSEARAFIRNMDGRFFRRHRTPFW